MSLFYPSARMDGGRYPHSWLLRFPSRASPKNTWMSGRSKRSLPSTTSHLEVEEGEIFGFLGRNGAGKTTTIKMLLGLIFPTAGDATIQQNT